MSDAAGQRGVLHASFVALPAGFHPAAGSGRPAIVTRQGLKLLASVAGRRRVF
jgi:hypothetical protein